MAVRVQQGARRRIQKGELRPLTPLGLAPFFLFGLTIRLCDSIIAEQSVGIL
jgi:hypothetical protein